MVSVRPVVPSNFEQIYPLLHWHDSGLEKSVWQRIFDYSWKHDRPYCGYGLFDGNEAVGFIGFIFCDRSFSKPVTNPCSKPVTNPCSNHPSNKANRFTKLCNLTTWVVKPQYRGHSISLMMPVIRMKEHIITDLSASDGVVELSKRLGFRVLDDAVKVLLPQAPSSTASIFTEEDISNLPLPSAERTIFQDHRGYANCHQIVLQAGENYCHIIYTVNREAELSYSHIQYINNLASFEQYQTAIRQRIIQDSQLPLIVIDSRLVASIKLPFSYHLPLSSPRIYRPAQSQTVPLDKSQIDNLYSELVLLEFGTADSLTLGWREKALSICSPAIEKLARCG